MGIAALLTFGFAVLLAVPTAQAGMRRSHAVAKHIEPVAMGPVTLTPAIVESGSPELIRVSGDYQSVEGEWFGRKIAFFTAHDHRAWYALAGVDVEAAAVPTTLRITAHLADKSTVDLSRNISIHAARYATGSLSVPPKFVEPGAEDQTLITAAVKAKEKAFASIETSETSHKPLWSGSFLAPVKAQATASFGTRRMFNGKLASIHKGTDFRAGAGTPVLAGNSGTVILAQPLYYEGNCVMVDHGMGLISISMHFSRIDVKPGHHVMRGQQLGLSGATGRVTGPHLHWAIRWKGAMLDPVKLLHLKLDQLP